MQLIQLEQPLAQMHITVHGGQAAAYRGNQVVVDFHGDFVAVERGVQRRIVMPRIRKELQLPHLRRKDGGGGVAELPIHAVQRFKR